MMIPIYQLPVPVSSTFRHRPLDRRRQFRLLKLYPAHFALRKDAPWLIEFEIIHTDLDDAPPYETVSYVWGSSTRTKLLRLLPGNRTLAVTEAVIQLLSYLKKSSTTGYLWIDQLCINQDDELERNHQVTVMGEIYGRARRTLVWLGEPDADSRLVLKTLDILGSRSKSFAFRWTRKEAHADGKKDVTRLHTYLENKSPSTCSTHSTVRGAGSDIMDMDGEDETEDEGYCHQCFEEAAVERVKAACRLLNRPWFTRSWIAQEVLLAKEVYLMLGDSTISPKDFYRAIHANLHTPKFDRVSSELTYNVSQDSGFSSLNYLMYFWDSLENNELPLFSSILDDLRDGIASGTFKASDPRDFIYAFMGLHPHSKALISPNYSWPVEYVYADATMAVVEETGDLSVLGLCDSFYHKLSSPGLPSWVPNWSRACWPRTLFGPGRNQGFTACGAFKHALQPRTISPQFSVTGTPIDRITAIHPQEYPRERPGHFFQSTEDGERRDSQTPDYLELGKTAEELSAMRRPRFSDVTIGQVLNLLHARDTGFPDDYQYTWRERERILRYAAGRQIAQGMGEPLVLVPSPSVAGDEIWLLSGCPTPVVLRGTMDTKDGYQLVGACYVEGTMHGEQAHRLEAASAIRLT